MSMQPLTGDRPLTPVTREEAAVLAAGLLKLVDHHPWLGKEPLIEGYTRLLLTVPDEPLSPDREEMLQDDLRASRDETGRLTERVEYLRSEVTELQRQLAEAQKTTKPDPSLDLELRKARAAFAEAGQQLVELQRQVDQANAEVERRTQEVTRLNDKIRVLGRDAQAEAKAAATILSERDVLKTRITTLLAFARMVKHLEWSALHPTYTYSNTRKKVQCCPLCQGLNPTEAVGHRDAGHRKTCFLVRILQQLPLD